MANGLITLCTPVHHSNFDCPIPGVQSTLQLFRRSEKNLSTPIIKINNLSKLQ